MPDLLSFFVVLALALGITVLAVMFAGHHSPCAFGERAVYIGHAIKIGDCP